MAAYGLYTHIASNKTRSVLLLFGLFLLIYVIVFAGSIFLEVFSNPDGSVDYYLRAAWRSRRSSRSPGSSSPISSTRPSSTPSPADTR
jgi:hypothetical protein